MYGICRGKIGPELHSEEGRLRRDNDKTKGSIGVLEKEDTWTREN